MDMISLRHIYKRYGTHRVLEDVNLTIREGEIYGLIGKNGAGKTTIFKIILGLTEYETGQLSIAGSKTKSALSASRKKIGFFIGKNFFDYLTARENLEYYRQMKGIQKPEEVHRVLSLVDLQGVTAKFGSFSMGMKQRLGIAKEGSGKISWRSFKGKPHALPDDAGICCRNARRQPSVRFKMGKWFQRPKHFQSDRTG